MPKFREDRRCRKPPDMLEKEKAAGEVYSSAGKSNWTWERNKKFEVTLAKYDEDEPNRWAKIAEEVGGTDEEEVKRRYDLLLRHIDLILSGQLPLPHYKDTYTPRGSGKTEIITSLKDEKVEDESARLSKKHGKFASLNFHMTLAMLLLV